MDAQWLTSQIEFYEMSQAQSFSVTRQQCNDAVVQDDSGVVCWLHYMVI